MPDIFYDVDTALAEVPVNIFPLTDDTDMKSIEGAVAYNAAGMALRWHFVTTAGAYTVTSVTPSTGGSYDWTDQGDSGIYTIEIPASDPGGGTIWNDTEGFGWFTGVATGILPWRGPVIGFRRAALNNLLINGSTASTNLEDFFDGTGYAGGTARLKVDVDTLKTQAITCAAGVTILASVGTAATAVAQSRDLTDAVLATAIWNAATVTYGAAGSYGLLVETNLDAAITSRSTYAGADTAGTTTLLGRIVGTLATGTHNPQTGDAYAIVNNGTYGNSALQVLLVDIPTVAEFEARTIAAADYFVVTDYTAPKSVAEIATGVWQDATAGDFTAVGSIGKSLFTAGAVPGAAGGLFIAGSNAATTVASWTCTAACTNGSTVLGNTTIGTLTQTGAVSWGATTFASVVVSGTTTFTGAVALSSTLGIAGVTTLYRVLVTGFIDVTGTISSGANGIPWNANWDAEVQSEVDDALKALLSAGQWTKLAAIIDGTPSGSVVDDNDPDPTATAFETDLSSAIDDFVLNAWCVFTSGALIGQAQKVSDYNGTTKVLTVASAFTAAPAVGDDFVLIGRG